MSKITKDCEFCGADSDQFAFLKYHADPNDAQSETDWFENTPGTIYSVVCTGCGMSKGCIDPRDDAELPDFEELPHGTDDDMDFRVDEVLE